jgi:hypothetical protein
MPIKSNITFFRKNVKKKMRAADIYRLNCPLRQSKRKRFQFRSIPFNPVKDLAPLFLSKTSFLFLVWAKMRFSMYFYKNYFCCVVLCCVILIRRAVQMVTARARIMQAQRHARARPETETRNKALQARFRARG